MRQLLYYPHLSDKGRQSWRFSFFLIDSPILYHNMPVWNDLQINYVLSPTKTRIPHNLFFRQPHPPVTNGTYVIGMSFYTTAVFLYSHLCSSMY